MYKLGIIEDVDTNIPEIILMRNRQQVLLEKLSVMKGFEKKYILVCIILILVSFSMSNSIFAQTIEKEFDLNFTNISGRKFSWLSSADNFRFRIDSSAIYNNKYPLEIYPAVTIPSPFEEDNTDEYKAKMKFVMKKTVILPRDIQAEDIFDVSLSCKTGIGGVIFKVIALDCRENILYSDFMYVPTKHEWDAYSLKFFAPGAQALEIVVMYDGWKNSGVQMLIDKIRIKSGETDINALPLTALDRKPDMNDNYIIPLDGASSFSKIPQVKGKKLVGLGESMHGSQNIKETCYEFIKYLVEEENCKNIMLETGLDLALLFDLYVQGIMADDRKEEIMDALKAHFGNYETTFSFLNFLRDYNKNKVYDDRVKLFGIDVFKAEDVFLGNYFLSLLGADSAGYYIYNIGKRNYAEVIDRLSTDSKITSVLGEKDIKYLKCVMEARMNMLSLPKGTLHKIHRRDSSMFENVNNIMDIFFTDIDMGVIFAHSININKGIPFNLTDNEIPLGYHLKSKYENMYVSVAVQAGEGAYSEDSLILGATITSNPLQTAPDYSLENACLKKNIDRFFYPADRLPDSILALRRIPRESINAPQFTFCHIPKHFDGVLFIRDSRPLDTFQNYPAYHFSSYTERKGFLLTSLWGEYHKSIYGGTNNENH